MTKFNGISKVKIDDGKFLVRITDGDMEFDPISEEEYRHSMMTPDFDDLSESEWLPARFKRNDLKVNNEENQAFNDGLDAQNNGAERGANPHLSGTPSHDAWEMGWQQGADEDHEEDMNRE
jgi:hypothetical protein